MLGWSAGLCILAWAPAVHAQDADTVVGDVRFDGAVRTTEAYMRSFIKSRPQTPFSQDTLDADVVRLLRTGKFLTVTADTDVAGGRVAITFHVVERPTVQGIRFEGNRAISENALLEKVPVSEGDPFDVFAVREGRDNILNAYRAKGFGHAEVTVDEAVARAGGDLVYIIEEGPKVRVREVLFEGHRALDARTLSKQVRTKSAFWIFRAGTFDPQLAADDAGALQRLYRRQGFLDARVSYRVDPGAEPGDLQVVFIIAEGEPYVIESIQYLGNAVFSNDELMGLSQSRAQQVVRQDLLDADVKAIQTAYGELGYIYASVRAVRVFSTTPGWVLISIHVNEGEQIQVGRIAVRGNETTQDKVVRRALDLYPGEIFNLSLVRRAEESLRATQIFERVSVSPVGTEPGVRDIVVNVLETENTNDLLFGFGVTSNSGLVGSLMLDIKNFNLLDTPRSFAELIKFRAFRGAGQRLRLELQPGTELNRFRVDFTEPYLFDQPLRFDLSLYHFTRIRRGYDERRTGSSVSVGKRLVEGLGPGAYFKDWYGETAFRLETVSINDVGIFDHRSVRDMDGSSVLTSVKGTLVRDRTDNRFAPTSGDRLTLSFEQFVGDFNFGKVRANYARHFTMWTDPAGRKSVVSLRVNTGYIVGDAPVFENFYAGGIGSLRGFDFRGVGPRGGLSKDPLGGKLLATGSAEYSFPLAGDLLRGVLFTDMGTVEREFELSSWRMSVGVGIRLTVQMFGPVPIEIDFAAPVLRDGDDEVRVFSFFIGGMF